MHPRVLPELVDVVAKPFSIILKGYGYQVTGKREKSLPILRCVGRELQASEPYLCSWKGHGMVPSGSYVKADARQGAVPEQPVWLHQGQIIHHPSLLVFYDGLLALVDKEEATYVVCLDCCKAFDVVHTTCLLLERDVE